MNEFSFNYSCGVCHGWFTGKTVGVPVNKDVDIIAKGFLCPKCYEKRKSADVLRSLLGD